MHQSCRPCLSHDSPSTTDNPGNRSQIHPYRTTRQSTLPLVATSATHLCLLLSRWEPETGCRSWDTASRSACPSVLTVDHTRLGRTSSLQNQGPSPLLAAACHLPELSLQTTLPTDRPDSLVCSLQTTSRPPKLMLTTKAWREQAVFIPLQTTPATPTLRTTRKLNRRTTRIHNSSKLTRSRRTVESTARSGWSSPLCGPPSRTTSWTHVSEILISEFRALAWKLNF